MSFFREPLVHFLIFGALLFALDRWTGESDAESRIDVDARQIERLQQAFAAQWRRAPSAEELRGLVEQHIEEEVLYREALSLGLDDDDTIVRRRLAQKMQFLIEDTTEPATPTEADLTGYFEAHRAEFRTAPFLTFSHVYFSADRRADAAADARAALATIARDPGSVRGDPFMLRYDYADVTRDDVARLFGGEFADALFALTTDDGIWQGPVRSGYGWHLVRVVAKTTPAEPAFADVREGVLAAWLDDARRRANRENLDRLRAQYEIAVHAAPSS
jgi:hypothetical protein